MAIYPHLMGKRIYHKCSPETKVDTGSAHCGVAYVLLHVGSGPAGERSEIAEAVNAIVVSVPEWNIAEPSAVVSTAEDVLPHVVVSIDTWNATIVADGLDKLTEESAVLVRSALVPAAP